MNWIESFKKNARNKRAADMAAEEAVRRGHLDELKPIERRKKIAEAFLSQFLPLVIQVQKDLQKAGYKHVLGSRGSKKYGQHEFGYNLKDIRDAYESRKSGDTDTNSSWYENYCMTVDLGDLGELYLVPTGQEEDNLGLYCVIALPGNPIEYEGMQVSDSKDTQIVLDALQQTVGKSVEETEMWQWTNPHGWLAMFRR